MTNRIFIALVILFFLVSCKTVEQTGQNLLKVGYWRYELVVGDKTLPFQMEVYEENGALLGDVINGDERITIKDISTQGDTIRLRLPLFDSELIGHKTKEGVLTGYWLNYDREDYQIPFRAIHNQTFRFCPTAAGKRQNITGKYEVVFGFDSDDGAYPAIGEFQQDESGRVTGTFMTETGDYRFLEGNICDGKLLLSCFDGSHAFRFEADIKGDSLVNGEFLSGKHWGTNWVALRNDKAALSDPHSITQVIDTAAMYGLSFPGAGGANYTIEPGNGEVTILQIMGSWCPNCIDETRVYHTLHDKYSKRGLRIVPIAFESEKEVAAGLALTSRLEKRLGLPYPIFYGGYRSKSVASERFPFLSGISSFPTSILIDREGNVRDVHTGFYGPGTKQYYEDHLNRTEALIVSLLEE